MKSSENIDQPDQAENPATIHNKEAEFIAEKITPFIKNYQFQIDFNRFLGIIFSLASIGLSLGVTVAGINGNARLAAGLGAASAAVQSAFGIFPLEKRVWFYRASVAEAQKIKTFLEYKADYSIEKVVVDFEDLRTRTLTQEPLNTIPDSLSPNTTSLSPDIAPSRSSNRSSTPDA